MAGRTHWQLTDAYERLESIRKYERLHDDTISLDHISEVMERIGGSGGRLGAQCAWYDKACPSLQARFAHNPSQAEADRRALERATATRNALKPASDALCRIWELVSSQLRACEHDIEVYRNRRCFFSLPDEILSTVLEYAALRLIVGDRKKGTISTVKAAAKLSHVCKHFRHLITHSPTLWKSVFGGMSNNMMSRCRTDNAEISLSTSFYKLDTRSSLPFTSFIRAVTETSQKWSCFTLNDPFPDSYYARRDFDDGQLQELAELTKGLSVPNLSKLTIFYPRSILSARLQSDPNLINASHYYSTWSMPTLRSMTVHNMVPTPFSGTSSITYLNIALAFSLEEGGNDGVSILDVKALVSFLSVCSALVELTLGVGGARGATTPTISDHRIEMPRVNKLDLGFSDCHASPLKALFDAIYFPHVTTMRLFIKSYENEVGHFSDIFDTVLPEADTFPKLVDMNLVASTDDNYDTHDTFVVISIPFTKMPNLRSFELKTLTAGVQYIPDGVALPPIRTLVLRDCYQLENEWLAQFLRQLKAQGDLDLLRVSVIGCKSSRPMNNFGVEGPLSKEDILWFVE